MMSHQPYLRCRTRTPHRFCFGFRSPQLAVPPRPVIMKHHVNATTCTHQIMRTSLPVLLQLHTQCYKSTKHGPTSRESAVIAAAAGSKPQRGSWATPKCSPSKIPNAAVQVYPLRHQEPWKEKSNTCASQQLYTVPPAARPHPQLATLWTNATCQSLVTHACISPTVAPLTSPAAPCLGVGTRVAWLWTKAAGCMPPSATSFRAGMVLA